MSSWKAKKRRGRRKRRRAKKEKKKRCVCGDQAAEGERDRVGKDGKRRDLEIPERKGKGKLEYSGGEKTR